MNMNEYLYNTHDLPVVITIGQSLLLACILLLTREITATGNGLLAFLVIIFGAQALDVLIYWNVNIKPMVAPIGAWVFWVFKWVPILQGPLLYAYVRTRISGQYVQFPRDFMHLAGPFIGCLLLYFTYIGMDEETRIAGVNDFGQWFKQMGYYAFTRFSTFCSVAYGIGALWYLKRHTRLLENRYSNVALAQPLWLKTVVYGFLGIHLWSFSMVVASFLGFNEITHPMGITFNYFTFVFINALVFFSLLQSHLVVLEADSGGQMSSPQPDIGQKKRSDAALARQLHELMLEQHLYLNPDLTLAQLAQAGDTDERKASEVINEHLGQNFFELVNVARIATAKKLLDSTLLPVQKVYARAGFNSKATFYRIFRRYEFMTPTEYRQRDKS